MEYNLFKIKSSIDKISKAIISVLDLDLTIVDKDLVRIFASGKYKEKIGKKVDKSSVFSYALKKKKSFIIKEPKRHEACKKCSKRNDCEEYAEVCTPIIVDNEVIGVIALIAFNQKQREKIINNDKNILNFLDQMSKLIATKFIEKRSKDQLKSQADELEFILDSVETSIISIDPNGEIIHFNKMAKETFEKVDKDINLFDYLSIKKIKLQDIKSIIYNQKINFNKKRYVYTVKPIYNKNELVKYIFEFEKIESIIDVVNEITGDNLKIKFNDIIGNSKKLKDVKKVAKIASNSESNVLIQGESGVGKELFARSIHYESNRSNGPFIAINCAAIPERLLESELFGYKEGAFTGAKKGGKIGKFELSNNGTIFLDEIGELPLHLQSKLLRVIQHKEIMPVGSNKLIKINSRIIAATNKDLEKMVDNNEFRDDLFYRLNVIPLNIPSLKERKKDIIELSKFFLKKYNNKLNKRIEKIDTLVFDRFLDHNWKGNIRELENVIEFCVNMAKGKEINISDLPNKFNSENNKVKSATREILSIESLEKREILKAIKKYGKTPEGYKNAYTKLGISRATFYRKLKKYNIN
ncbi:MAG: sigma 54-interacting transcriptional regulator [Bacillota bacterium]